MTSALESSRIFRRLNAGGWSLGDQAVVSLGNFLTNVCLARNLRTADYGIWALLYGLLLFFYTIHASLVTYPLSVGDAKFHLPALRRDGTCGLLVTLAMGLPFGGIIFAVATALANRRVGVCCVLAMLFWYLQETLRRELMAALRHRRALSGDIVSYGGQALLIFLLARNHMLSLVSALLAMAGTSAVAALIQFGQLGFVSVGLRETYSWFRQSCAMGGWATLASVATSISGQAFPWFLAIRGPAETANFQSLANLVGVTTPVMLGISNLIIPAVSHSARKEVEDPLGVTVSYGLQGAFLILPYYIVLLLVPGKSLSLLYGVNSPFVALSAQLRIFVVAAAFMYAAHIACAFLYGIKRAASVFQAQVSGIPIVLILGLPFTLCWGVRGACFGLLVLYASRTLIAMNLVRRSSRTPTWLKAPSRAEMAAGESHQ